MQEDQFYSEIFPEKQVVYGTFWERFAAAFIDGLIIIVINTLIGLPLGIGPFQRSAGLTGNVLLAKLLQTAAGWLYYALQESGPRQATLGKKAMNLKVTDMEGNRISFGRATGRHFAKWISAIILLIGYLMMLWDDKKQALHDKIAGTLIVDSRAS
ncbi:RDD family protein [Taibaiella koreensis]|uniref:RDD family protein n=1 Tax=Taibaiella koreensis TaxID=1268548 RepID=UPI000E59B9DA|nr:RDD family protein [Taibaiella koreensis]